MANKRGVRAKSIGDRVFEWRTAQNLSCRQAAKYLRLDYSQVNRIENGKSIPRPDTARRIEKVIDYDIDPA